MKENKATGWKWMVILLAVLNIVLLVTIWKGNDAPHEQGPPRDGGPAKMIIAELKFDDKQIEAFEKLKHEHHSSILELQAKGKELRDGLFEFLKQENPDSAIVNQKIDLISHNQKQIEAVTFAHFKEVRKLCNDDQKKRFDLIIKDVLHTMARPHRHGPPPDHDGPPPHPHP